MTMNNLEVFYMDAEEFMTADDSTWMYDRMTDKKRDGFSDQEAAESLAGFYYWFCFPGCLPEGDAIGPFETETRAYADAESMGV